jgi:biotin synthase-related radical SAM superfamily protein
MRAKQFRSRIVERGLPSQVRVSLGSAMILGLVQGKFATEPTTAYLMTYRHGKCVASCGFCSQSRQSRGRSDLLSRVSWPVFPTSRILESFKIVDIQSKVRRICIQALNYPKVIAHLCALTRVVHECVQIPISISCQPLDRQSLMSLAEAGAERIGIPLDAATRKIFDTVKGRYVGGPYSWDRVLELLTEAVGIFGRGKVSTHLIVGLGETEKEMVEIIQHCADIEVLPGLFAFTPIRGTSLEKRDQPPIQAYRRIQIARHLILHRLKRFEEMQFGDDSQIVDFGVGREALTRLSRQARLS